MSERPVLPGAEPFPADGGPVGVLVSHGFTGNPHSMRALAEAFATAGHTVERVSLDRSFHVATLDHDKDLIIERALAFVDRVTA